MDAPLISCIMATRGNAFPARYAIQCYQRQTHPRRELVIVCRNEGREVRDLVAGLADPTIRFFSIPYAESVGELRNAAMRHAQGDLFAIWDDDDLSHPERLALQQAGIAATGATASFLSRVALWWPARGRIAESGWRTWENTMLVRRSAIPAYSSLTRGSDTELVRSLRATAPLALIDRPDGYYYVCHGGNLWGADHFEMLFRGARRCYEGAMYGNILASPAPTVPLADYARELGSGLIS
ncbi:hypothetical protein ACFB49_35820 [Sphingomonas sp. DBB INV C78]|uniref:glycosyltransferase family 2 protein n=1 Tax=Sphingomonas sp. DBB INV C78 TaxID=3349434 RepID=UPI0036D2C146